MRVHRLLDDAGDRGEAEPAFQKARHDDLVRRVQDDREAALGLERPVREPKTGKGVGVWRLEFKASGTREIERHQGAGHRSGYEKAY